MGFGPIIVYEIYSFKPSETFNNLRAAPCCQAEEIKVHVLWNDKAGYDIGLGLGPISFPVIHGPVLVDKTIGTFDFDVTVNCCGEVLKIQ